MRMRSTGLGTTELVGNVSDITRENGYLVLHVNTIEPVRWHVRTAMSWVDLFKIGLLMIKPPTLLFVLTSLFQKPKQGAPVDF
jgi:hypothetical protein